jgi:hypothetical protein
MTFSNVSPADKAFYNLADISFTASVSGYGLSGCVSKNLSFKFHGDPLDLGNTPGITGGTCQLHDTLGEIIFPEMYINTKNIEDMNVTFNCVDKMVHSDTYIDLTAFGAGVDENALISGAQLMTACTEQMGMSDGVTHNAAGFSEIWRTEYPVSQYTGRTIRAILEEISQCLCAVWIYGANGSDGITLLGLTG